MKGAISSPTITTSKSQAALRLNTSPLSDTKGGHDFRSYWGEFECSASARWTNEMYLDGQTTFEQDSSVFKGFRWESMPVMLTKFCWLLNVRFETVDYDRRYGVSMQISVWSV